MGDEVGFFLLGLGRKNDYGFPLLVLGPKRFFFASLVFINYGVSGLENGLGAAIILFEFVDRCLRVILFKI